MYQFRSDAERHALHSVPHECCGLVVEGVYRSCRNIAVDPTEAFVIHPQDYLDAVRSGYIDAIVHSHPKGGGASEADLNGAKYTEIPWHIFSVPDKSWSIIGNSSDVVGNMASATATHCSEIFMG